MEDHERLVHQQTEIERRYAFSVTGLSLFFTIIEVSFYLCKEMTCVDEQLDLLFVGFIFKVSLACIVAAVYKEQTPQASRAAAEGL